MIPSIAIAIPTEHIIIYFQAASKENLSLSNPTRNTDAKVVASIAIHIIPMFFTTSANTIVKINKCMSM